MLKVRKKLLEILGGLTSILIINFPHRLDLRVDVLDVTGTSLQVKNEFTLKPVNNSKCFKSLLLPIFPQY